MIRSKAEGHNHVEGIRFHAIARITNSYLSHYTEGHKDILVSNLLRITEYNLNLHTSLV